jgi:Flp pilus assembly protein TadD
MNEHAASLKQTGLAALKAGRLEEAITALEAAVEADPESYEAWSYLGGAYTQKRDYESAWYAFERAIKIQPKSAKARYNLGLAHRLAGRIEAARACFQEALQLDPNYTAAQNELAKLPPPETEEKKPAPSGRLTPQDIARLAAPPGHIHMMGAQASSVKKDSEKK